MQRMTLTFMDDPQHHHHHQQQSTSLLDACIPYISANNKDIDTKLSGYVPWGLSSTSRSSWMTLSFMSPLRNPQHHQSTSLLCPPPIPDTLLIKISIQNFQCIFLMVNKHHPWHLGLPCPPSLRSGTLNVLQVPPDPVLQEPSTSSNQVLLSNQPRSNCLVHFYKRCVSGTVNHTGM